MPPTSKEKKPSPFSSKAIVTSRSAYKTGSTTETVELRRPGTGKLASKLDEKNAEFESLEAANYKKALEAMAGVVGFAEVSPDAKTPPPEWVSEYGIKAATRMLRYAKLAQLTKRDAPIGLSMVAEVIKTERRARAAEKENQAPELNVAIISMPLVSDIYDVIDATPDEDPKK